MSEIFQRTMAPIKLAADLTDAELFLIAKEGFARLMRDINSTETMLDLVALRLKKAVAAESMSLPGHERPRHWFESNTNGFADDSHG